MKRYVITIGVDSNPESKMDFCKELEPIHEILVGNADYVKSNIVYNIDDGANIFVDAEHLIDRESAEKRLARIIHRILNPLT